MDPKAQKWYGIVAAVVVVIAAVGWYFAVHNKAVAPSSTNNATSTNATSTGDGQVHVTGVVDTSGIPAPSLDRSYTPPSYLPADAKAQNVKDYNTTVSTLKFDPTNHAYWLQLALYRKGAGDYTGAEEIWIYVTKRWPDDPIPYNDLADLYLNFTHEPAKAKAIVDAGFKLFPDDAGLKAYHAQLQ